MKTVYMDYAATTYVKPEVRRNDAIFHTKVW